jgi:Ger(x)C family germination protein
MYGIKNKPAGNIVFLLFILIILSGCSKLPAVSRDITDFRLVSVIGIDNGEDDKIILTVSAAAEKNPKGDDSKDSKPFTHTMSSLTISRAFSEMDEPGNKRMFLGHNRCALIGEDMAKRGVNGVLDFFTRDAEARLDTALFVVKSGSAEDLLTDGGKTAERLNALEKDPHANYGAVSAVEVSRALGENGSAVIRTLKDAKNGFETDGLAIIKGGKLVGYVDKDETSGYDLLNDGRYRGVLEVKAPDGKAVSLKPGKLRHKYDVEWREDKPVKLKVTVKFKSVLNGSLSKTPVEDEGFLRGLEAAQNEVVRQRTQAIIDKSKELQCEFIGIGEELNRKHPVRFSRISERWGEIWAELPVEIEVCSKVSSGYNVVGAEA